MLPDEIHLFRPKRIRDDRGWLLPAWSGYDFVDEVHTYSYKAGTLRGLHFQRPPHEQGKLIRVLRGRVFDVAVDIRPTDNRGSWFAMELAPTSGSLWIPAGYAHGLCTLEDATEVLYRMDTAYQPASAAGLAWDAVDIPWPAENPILSDIDKAWGGLEDL